MALSTNAHKPLYRWQGKNHHGHDVQGQMAADNSAQVKVLLRKQGIQPVWVRRQSRPLLPPRQPKITALDIALFSRMLATLLSSGVPLIQAMQLIAEGHDNARMQRLVLDIKANVESGTSLTQALAAQDRYFNPLYISLIQAGEQSGTLDNLLDEIACYQEKTEALKIKVKKALMYPSVIILVAISVTIILMIAVIPQFESLFRNFGADLPVLTRGVIQVSQVFQAHIWSFIIAICAMVYTLLYLRRHSAKVRYIMDHLLLKLPVLGEVLSKAAIARFARTFATLFNAGVPMVDAMDSLAGVTGNAVYQQAVFAVRNDIINGSQLHISLSHSRYFPTMVTQMIAIGEESGALDTMLSKVADIYERDVDSAVDNLTTLLEPVIMVVLGVVVGTLVIAMYLPVFQLGSAV